MDTLTTAAVVAYYKSEKTIKISYAGHPPVFYKRQADAVWSLASFPNEGNSCGNPLNMPLALDEDTHYSQYTVRMDSGDRLFAYTDGIIEAPDPSGNRFGAEYIKKFLDAHCDVPLPDLKTGLLEELTQYITHAPDHDDITLIALEIV